MCKRCSSSTFLPQIVSAPRTSGHHASSNPFTTRPRCNPAFMARQDVQSNFEILLDELSNEACRFSLISSSRPVLISEVNPRTALMSSIGYTNNAIEPSKDSNIRHISGAVDDYQTKVSLAQDGLYPHHLMVFQYVIINESDQVRLPYVHSSTNDCAASFIMRPS